MRLKNLGQLKKASPKEVIFTQLPEVIHLSDYAREKAFLINKLVRQQFQRSYEWYGFTLGRRAAPELIVDIGLPVQDQNLEQYVSLAPEKIAVFRDSLPEDLLINGWIHSHGNLSLHQFSDLDQANHATVLDFVTAELRLPLAKVQVLIGDLTLLVADSWQEADLRAGSVSLITDVPIKHAELWELVYGGFCYAIVIGDSGWHLQEIHYKKRGLLSGQVSVWHQQATIRYYDDGRRLPHSEVEALAEEVATKLAPVSYLPPKMESL